MLGRITESRYACARRQHRVRPVAPGGHCRCSAAPAPWPTRRPHLGNVGHGVADLGVGQGGRDIGVLAQFRLIGPMRHRAQRTVTVEGPQPFFIEQVALEEFGGQEIVGRSGIDHGRGHPEQRLRPFLPYLGQRRHAEVDAALFQVAPGPGAADHGRHLATIEARGHDVVVGSLGQHAGVDQLAQALRALHGPGIVDADVADVISLGGPLVGITTIGGQQGPAVIGFAVVEQDRLLALLAQFGVELGQGLETFRRCLDDILVVDQTQRLH